MGIYIYYTYLDETLSIYKIHSIYIYEMILCICSKSTISTSLSKLRPPLWSLRGVHYIYIYIYILWVKAMFEEKWQRIEEWSPIYWRKMKEWKGRWKVKKWKEKSSSMRNKYKVLVDKESNKISEIHDLICI